VIGLDTNVLARYFVAEQGADPATERQRQAARTLIESGKPLFLPKTVALELEWMLRGYYGFGAEQVLQVFAHLRGGLDFADALHHASCRGCEAVASFDDRGFARRARHLNLAPRVVVPSTP